MCRRSTVAALIATALGPAFADADHERDYVREEKALASGFEQMIAGSSVFCYVYSVRIDDMDCYVHPRALRVRGRATARIRPRLESTSRGLSLPHRGMGIVNRTCLGAVLNCVSLGHPSCCGAVCNDQYRGHDREAMCAVVLFRT